MSARYDVTTQAERYVLTDRETAAEAVIVPGAGNNVTHFRVRPAGRTEVLDALLPPSEGSGLGSHGYGAGNPILFPFPNRVREGKYTFEGRSYQLEVNETARGNHIHGLVSNRPWQVEATGASEADGAWQRAFIELQSFPDAARQYPFPCRLTVTTRLRDGTLIQEIAVRNTGSARLPMGFGTHPWFPAVHPIPSRARDAGDAGAGPAVLDEDGGARAMTEVLVPADRYWELEGLVPTGRTVPVDEHPEQFDLRTWHALDGHEYDDVFTALRRRGDGWSEAGIRYPAAGLELMVEASPEFREWVLYAPTSRAVVCLEPYTGTTNAVNLEPQGIDAGLVVLDPGQEWSGVIRTSLRSVAPSPPDPQQ
ncbi:MAG TPA: aldose 1-epimerase [Chloroflexota bacterium]|nr:aldose 1-epimerase [Chloroflexota bacterium]